MEGREEGEEGGRREGGRNKTTPDINTGMLVLHQMRVAPQPCNHDWRVVFFDLRELKVYPDHQLKVCVR